MISLLSQVFKFGFKKSKWWMIPLIIFMLTIGLTLFVVQSAAVAQFIYAIF